MQKLGREFIGLFKGLTLSDKKEKPFPLSALPPDVLRLILTRLPYPAQLRLSRTCRKWRAILNPTLLSESKYALIRATRPNFATFHLGASERLDSAFLPLWLKIPGQMASFGPLPAGDWQIEALGRNQLRLGTPQRMLCSVNLRERSYATAQEEPSCKPPPPKPDGTLVRNGDIQFSYAEGQLKKYTTKPDGILEIADIEVSPLALVGIFNEYLVTIDMEKGKDRCVHLLSLKANLVCSQFPSGTLLGLTRLFGPALVIGRQREICVIDLNNARKTIKIFAFDKNIVDYRLTNTQAIFLLEDRTIRYWKYAKEQRPAAG